MRFSKALADRAIAVLKIEIAGLTDCVIDFFGLPGRSCESGRAIADMVSVRRVRDRLRRCKL